VPCPNPASNRYKQIVFALETLVNVRIRRGLLALSFLFVLAGVAGIYPPQANAQVVVKVGHRHHHHRHYYRHHPHN